MKYFLTLFCFGVASFLSTVHAAEAISWKGKTDFACGGEFYVCLVDEDLRLLIGKTLNYKHPRGGDFGTVSITLKPNNTAEAKNGKGGVNGSWEIKDGRLAFKTNSWGDFTLKFVRIGAHLFMISNRETGVVSLVLVEVAE